LEDAQPASQARLTPLKRPRSRKKSVTSEYATASKYGEDLHMDDWIIGELEDDFDELQHLISMDEMLQNERLARVFHRLQQMFEGLES
jgi:hypothetical protein